jgi:hypothetical protein
MHPDIPWLQALEGTCKAKHGEQKEALIILEKLQEFRLTEYIDAYHLALLLDALGKRSEAFQEQERAAEENSASLFLLDVDRRIDALRGDPRFASPIVQNCIIKAKVAVQVPFAEVILSGPSMSHIAVSG